MQKKGKLRSAITASPEPTMTFLQIVYELFGLPRFGG